MQSLSILPLKGDFFEVPQFTSHLCATSFGCTIKRRSRRRKNSDIFDFNSFRRDSFLFASKCLLDIGDGASCSSHLDLEVGYLNTRVVFYGGCRSSVRMCFALGWVLEEQALGNKENSEQIDDTYSRETRGDIVDDGVTDATLLLNESESSGDIIGEAKLKGVCEGETIGRVDVRELGQRLLLAQSVEDVEVVLKNMDELPLQVYSSIIKGFGREKRLEPAMAVIDWLKKKHEEDGDFEGPNLFIYNSLLGAVKQSEQFDKVEVVMNYMQEAGVSPNVVTYNTLMGIYLDQGRSLEALNVFEDIQSKGISPSSATYHAALLAYRRLEDGNGALKLFVALKEKYANGELRSSDGEDWETELVKLKSFTARTCYQVIRQWLVNEGDSTTNVLKLLIEMDKAVLSPGREECERLVWACTREEHFSVAKELYGRLREHHSKISLSVCNHVIWLMGRAKKWGVALEIYDDLLEKGPEPNNLSLQLIRSHFNVLLGVARRRRIWSWGIRLLQMMEEKGLKPGSKEWNSVLIACSKASETNAAIQIFKQMIEKGEKPTAVSYGSLLSALEKGKLYDEAIRVWYHMLQVRVKPNIYAYTIMASVYVGLGKFNLVDHIIEKMVSTKIHPTVVTFNAIISICAKNGMNSAVYEWFHRMKTMSIEPNEITYDVMIEVLANDGKPRLAYDMFLRAVNSGLIPSGETYDAVIQSSESFGVTIDINGLGPRPLEKKMRNKNVVVTNNSLEFSNFANDLKNEPFDEHSFAQLLSKDL